MARLRYNGLTATLGADLLTADTTITFAAALTSAAGAVPTISGTDYIPLAVLDASGGVAEIIHLTAYTSGATTGTVTRAQESTTAADHNSGLTVVNGLTVADTAEFSGSGGTTITSATAESFTNQTCSSTTYIALSTPLSVTLTVPASGKVYLSLTFHARNGTAVYSRIDLSGANTLSSTTVGGEVTTEHYTITTSAFSGTTFTKLFTGLAAGSTTFAVKFANSAGTADINARKLTAFTL